uniref:Putative secreted protein n=1 Tax=Anopheles darlingi TaxID=43151 RepID=A0A2M4D8S3_ANODA
MQQEVLLVWHQIALQLLLLLLHTRLATLLPTDSHTLSCAGHRCTVLRIQGHAECRAARELIRFGRTMEMDW